MFNPFHEAAGGDSPDILLVQRAVAGDRAALEQLILRHQAWIFNIAVRMVFRPQDAEEVTQEVLVKAVTKLSTFKGESAFRTWLYRITANHVLNMKRQWAETQTTSFSDYGAAIAGIPDLDLPDPNSVPVEVPLLVEEAKVSCTTGMLLCMDRKQRLIFTLGEVLGVSDTVGGEILEMSADNFRQCLSRARRDLYQFILLARALWNPRLDAVHLRIRPGLEQLRDSLHGQIDVKRIVDQRFEAVLLIEASGLLVLGDRLYGISGDRLGGLKGFPECVDQQELPQPLPLYPSIRGEPGQMDDRDGVPGEPANFLGRKVGGQDGAHAEGVVSQDRRIGSPYRNVAFRESELMILAGMLRQVFVEFRHSAIEGVAAVILPNSLDDRFGLVSHERSSSAWRPTAARRSEHFPRRGSSRTAPYRGG